MIHFVAALTQDKKLLQALTELPTALHSALQQDWSSAITEYQHAHNTFVVGRGLGYPIAEEAALKFKETAKIHAEAFSGAELLHGPFALVEKHFPLLLFAQQDESFAGMLAIAKRVHAIGARVMIASPEHTVDLRNEPEFIQLPMPQGLHPICDPLMMIQAFYIMMARLSVARGFNPDVPFNLTKVTKTW
ncbi:MAG: hypothetical protein ACD_45C00169G0004 [uncultured bacterium]|nr:MAG: hypothetical protein ACD_45C00169G0004 [uncultured bacterium]